MYLPCMKGAQSGLDKAAVASRANTQDLFSLPACLACTYAQGALKGLQERVQISQTSLLLDQRRQAYTWSVKLQDQV